MKRTLAMFIGLFGVLSYGCSQQQRPPLGRTDGGTVIKNSGWELPVSLPEGRQYHATTVVLGDRRVEVLNSPYFPTDKLMVRTPKFWDTGDAEYKVTQILEFTDVRRKPYCYQLFVRDERSDPDDMRIPAFFSYRDDDGDGVFETLGEACEIPDWVK